jgi:hypothetical protein
LQSRQAIPHGTSGQYLIALLQGVVWGGVRTRDTTIRVRTISARQQLGQLACACQLLAAARGGFLPSAAAIAEISGRMKKASSAG